MKRIIKKFEDLMIAITFAEAGEYEMAQKVMIQMESEDSQEIQKPEPLLEFDTDTA